jgi:hypothetical protein
MEAGPASDFRVFNDLVCNITPLGAAGVLLFSSPISIANWYNALMSSGPMWIRILEKDNNRRGDLFGRLMSDLFVSLGYDPPSLNIHKSGRELDLSASHRIEPRRAIGECKATVEPVGGDDINKFVGALDAEQDGHQAVTGYFISLAGFKETAIEQEKNRPRTKIIMLTAAQVVDHLITGRMLIPKVRATELAGRCCASLNHLFLDPEAELLAHERGWVWAVYFTQGKARTHFALIHSDGTPLARAIANEVIASDSSCGGSLHELSCLNPTPGRVDDAPVVASALAAYREYLEAECGFIQLDGLPADSEAGSRRLRLENIFVPLHLDLANKQDHPAAEGEDSTEQDPDEHDEKERQPAGIVVNEHPRLALLAAPGGGKSTLLKRLAVAYADPARREQIADDLPKRDWLPLFFRCRELRALARGSFFELLDALSQREPVRQHALVFRAYVDRMLLAGKVLLLIDGLDEISDTGDRAAFVCTIRAALQAYPGIAMVVTSREAGFRHVAAHLTAICVQATLSPFGADDIVRLSIAWHREVINNSDKVRVDAQQLAATIVKNDRIRRLAVNPLLLTTLLLVKRWVGSLPTRRAVLYGKAVELLLMTWNVEGHEPISQEEALPQLCYVASTMMLKGAQKISRPRLATLLKEARNALPTELGYVKGTVDEFIQRVEDRSSLLMMTGLDVEDGLLVEFFEFRHLTFQEFLTARAMVEGWHPGRSEKDTLVSVLEPHFKEEKWGEVIPLAAVLGGKATETLIQELTQLVRALEEPIIHINSWFLALGNSLADEAAARPETVRAALHEIARFGSALEQAPFTEALSRSRYGTDFRDEARRIFLEAVTDHNKSSSSLAQVVIWQTLETIDTAGVIRAVTRLDELMQGTESIARCEGALGLMFLCFLLTHRLKMERPAYVEPLQNAGRGLLPLIFSSDPAQQCAGSWGLAWLGECEISIPSGEEDTLGRLFTLWRTSQNTDIRHFSAWAIIGQPLIDREQSHPFQTIQRSEVDKLLQVYGEIPDERQKTAALIAAWYLRAWGDEEVAARAAVLKGLVGTGRPIVTQKTEPIARANCTKMSGNFIRLCLKPPTRQFAHIAAVCKTESDCDLLTWPTSRYQQLRSR